jgi:DNA-binding protein HU-beta
LCVIHDLPNVQSEVGHGLDSSFTKGKLVNKTQLVEALSAHFDGNRRAAAHALDSVVATVTREVAKGQKVAITGFGAFEKVTRPARMVRNPATGERVRAKKTSVPRFRAGTDLKAIVSGAKKAPKVTADTVRSSTPSATGTSTATKSTAKKGAAKKSTAKKSTAKKGAAKKSAAKKSTAKKSAAKKSTAKKGAAKKSTTKRAPAKKSTAKKSAAKKSTAKKTSAARTSTGTRSTTKKAPAKKSTAKRSARKS